MPSGTSRVPVRCRRRRTPAARNGKTCRILAISISISARRVAALARSGRALFLVMRVPGHERRTIRPWEARASIHKNARDSAIEHRIAAFAASHRRLPEDSRADHPEKPALTAHKQRTSSKIQGARRTPLAAAGQSLRSGGRRRRGAALTQSTHSLPLRLASAHEGRTLAAWPATAQAADLRRANPARNDLGNGSNE